MNLLDKAMDVIGATFGQVSTAGSPGSFLAYNMGRPFLYCWWFACAGKDYDSNQKFGTPYEATQKIKNLSGFFICKNASIEAFEKTPTADEYTQIIAILNSGAFME